MSEEFDKGETETPPWLFKALDHEFNFVLDAFASDTNHLCERPILDKKGRISSNDRDSVIVVWRPGVHSCIPSSFDVRRLREVWA